MATRRRGVTKEYDDAYKYCCQQITMLEQKKLFGTVGLENILKKYRKEDAVNRVKDYLAFRDEGLQFPSAKEN